MRKNDSESFESTLSVDSAKKMESRFLRFVILSVSFGEKFEKFGLSERKTPLLACDQAPRWGKNEKKIGERSDSPDRRYPPIFLLYHLFCLFPLLRSLVPDYALPHWYGWQSKNLQFSDHRFSIIFLFNLTFKLNMDLDFSIRHSPFLRKVNMNSKKWNLAKIFFAIYVTRRQLRTWHNHAE